MAYRQRSLLQAAHRLWAASSGSAQHAPSVCASLLGGLQQHAVSQAVDRTGQLHSSGGQQLAGVIRSFATANQEGAQLAATVLQQVNVNKLRQELLDESDTRVFISFSDFAARAMSCGAAKNTQEADELCSTLQKAGVVLRHGSTVYLRADDIAEMVMLLLPGGREDAEAKLHKVREELSQLEPLHRAAEKAAHRLTDRILAAGGCLLFVQLVAFIYLTWFELSWDVMEPFGYIISVFYSFVAYMYFLITRGRVFDLGPFRDYWAERFKRENIAKAQFDEDRYQYLLKLKDRYKRQLQQLPVGAVAAAAKKLV